MKSYPTSRPKGNGKGNGRVPASEPPPTESPLATFTPPLSYAGNVDDLNAIIGSWFRVELQESEGTVTLAPNCPEAIPRAVWSRPLAAQLADDLERLSKLYGYTAEFLRTLKETDLGIFGTKEQEGDG